MSGSHRRDIGSVIPPRLGPMAVLRSIGTYRLSLVAGCFPLPVCGKNRVQ
jgi:hypothetical protein